MRGPSLTMTNGNIIGSVQMSYCCPPTVIVLAIGMAATSKRPKLLNLLMVLLAEISSRPLSIYCFNKARSAAVKLFLAFCSVVTLGYTSRKWCRASSTPLVLMSLLSSFSLKNQSNCTFDSSTLPPLILSTVSSLAYMVRLAVSDPSHLTRTAVTTLLVMSVTIMFCFTIWNGSLYVEHTSFDLPQGPGWSALSSLG